ncbi:maleylpyruvate isomerase N-terminal domain-containing protein [Actinacidiphila acididurans]|uniref:Maleylpyruvate isomerase N-terminal domain-containing protein n=1 Tax=Actinacidiphila acididurans TaxID=2784346 RepID=A0ABS2TTM3_9ACTN|nr:maleylpyruvate isomerase N-terminal domain-containing protein [Actinacidiphila acididurans]MBM9506683.1 maleylpyruvate isomerase N-terminal domain-containing protein [Actinacidiphila acididurans]
MSYLDRWPAIRAGFEQVNKEFLELVDGVEPGRMATKDWTVADTAAHVTAIAAMYSSLVRGEPIMAFPQLQGPVKSTDVDSIHDFNALTLDIYTERRIPEIRERLSTDIDGILKVTTQADPARTVDWLGQAQVPIAGLFGHFINELQIHGRDIAQATGRPWNPRPQDASYFIEAFMVGMIQNGYGQFVPPGGPPRERRIAVEFSSDYTTPVTFVLHRGLVTIEDPRPDDDVRIFFDPVTMNLMLFGRISRVRAVLSRRVRISGPRPWLLPEFLRTVRTPR